MAQYKFQGRSAQGQEVSGVLEANSVDAAAGVLGGRGITPIKIDEVGASASIIRRLNHLLGANKVREVDLIMFCRQMYTITKSGIPLTRGLRGLAASLRHEGFRDTINDLAERLETGVSLSVAMGHHPKTFNSLFVSLISVGETSGQLDTVFEQIGGYIERDLETRKRISSAMRYPTFVVIALIAAVAIINTLVIPAFAKLFEQVGAELPLVTQILINTSNFFVNQWYVLLIGVILVVGSTVYYLGTEKGALNWGRVKLKMPIVGDLIDRASMARYTRTFSLMLASGVPITQSLGLCAGVINNPYLAQKINRIREGISRGDSLLRTHYQAEIFSPLVLQMVSVGEESGQVEELLLDVAEFYEREVEYDLKTLTDRIEPILIVSMAVMVAILALGIFLPMWNLYAVQ